MMRYTAEGIIRRLSACTCSLAMVNSMGMLLLFNVRIWNRQGCCARQSFCPNWESNLGLQVQSLVCYPLGYRFTPTEAICLHFIWLKTPHKNGVMDPWRCLFTSLGVQLASDRTLETDIRPPQKWSEKVSSDQPRTPEHLSPRDKLRSVLDVQLINQLNCLHGLPSNFHSFPVSY